MPPASRSRSRPRPRTNRRVGDPALADPRPRMFLVTVLGIYLAVCTLPLASNRPVFWVVNAVVIALLVLAACALAPRPGSTSRPGSAGQMLLGHPVCLALGLLVLLGLAQWVLSVWMPGLGAGLNIPAWAWPMSADPAASLASVLTLGALALAFALGAALCANPARATRLLAIHFWSCAAVGLISLMLFLIGFDAVLLWERWAYDGSLTGPFVNRNSFAAYLGTGMVSGVVLALGGLSRLRRERGRAQADGYILQGFLASTSTIPKLVALVILASALLLTQSRAGVGASIAALAIVFLLYVWRRFRRGGRVNVVALAIALATLPIALALFALSGEAVAERLATVDGSWAARALIYTDTIAGIIQRPLFGHGAGSFAAAFPAFRSAELAMMQGTIDLAHNTYLALAFEFGLPATLLWLATLAWIGLRLLSTMGSDHLDFELPLAALGFGALLALHSLVDFSAEMQAIALWFAVIGGAAVAQASLRFKKTTDH